MNFSSISATIKRLRAGKRARSRFVDSHLAKGIAYQIRALRERETMTQGELAELLQTSSTNVCRLESPKYGKQTLTSLKGIAAAFDVALIVRFVPFSQLTKWVSGIPYTDTGLSWGALSVPGFEHEEKSGEFDNLLFPPTHPHATRQLDIAALTATSRIHAVSAHPRSTGTFAVVAQSQQPSAGAHTAQRTA